MTRKMIAALIASSKWLQMERLADRYPSAMLPLMDRPFIQHIIENLINQGFNRIEVVLSHRPEKIEELLGDGKRWGVDIRYHLVADPGHSYRPIKLLKDQPDKRPILVAHTDRLVQVDIINTAPTSLDDGAVMYYSAEDTSNHISPQGKWSGWAWLSQKSLANMPDNGDENALLIYLKAQSDSRIEWVDYSRIISMRSCRDLIASHQDVLAKKKSGLMFRGQEIEESTWLTRNVSLHPTAKLIPPLYIGENCRIGRGAQIGPDAVIGHNCVADEKSTITRSVVFPGSYVGEALELSDAIVDKNCLINVRVGSEITIREDFILGSLTEKQLRRGLNRVVSQITAVLLLILSLPVLGILALYFKLRRFKRIFISEPMVRLPADMDPFTWKTFALISFYEEKSVGEKNAEASIAVPDKTAGLPVGWRHFFFNFLPALINVARGEMRFVGVPPRTMKETETLPPDWQSLYLKSKPGIVTETLVNFGPHATMDDRYSADAVYSVSSGLKHDVKILLKYFGQIFGLVPAAGK